jgi:arabinofuranosyltransferase
MESVIPQAKTKTTEQISRIILPLTLGMFIILGCIFTYLNLHEYAIDDAWITYRYAFNLSTGHGFVYNEGERVLGTSTPLYTLILASAHIFGSDIPTASHVLGFVSMVGTLLGVFLLGKQFGGIAVGLLAAMFLVFMHIFHSVAASGMETPFYMCAIVFSFYFFARERSFAASVCAAICLLIRLDGLAVGFALLASFVWIEKRTPWKEMLLYLIVVLPWFAFSGLYFGSIIPNSVLAKRVHGETGFRSWMLEWLSSQWYSYVAFSGAILCFLSRELKRAAAALAIWSISYILAFSFSGLYGHTWYRSPLCIPLSIFSGVFVNRIAIVFSRSRRVRNAMIAALSVILIVPPLLPELSAMKNGSYGVLRIEKTRFDAVNWIAQNIPKNAVIASGGIGQLGYVTGNYIVDMLGLVTPDVVRQSRSGAENMMRFAVEKYKPDYVFQAYVTVPGFMKPDYTVMKRWRTNDRLFPQFLLLKRIENEITN